MRNIFRQTVFKSLFYFILKHRIDQRTSTLRIVMTHLAGFPSRLKDLRNPPETITSFVTCADVDNLHYANDFRVNLVIRHALEEF